MASPATSRALVSQRAADKNVLSGTNETPRAAVFDQITNEKIQQLAYSLWEQRGCPEGSSEQDWIDAEAQVLNKP